MSSISCSFLDAFEKFFRRWLFLHPVNDDLKRNELYWTTEEGGFQKMMTRAMSYILPQIWISLYCGRVPQIMHKIFPLFGVAVGIAFLHFYSSVLCWKGPWNNYGIFLFNKSNVDIKLIWTFALCSKLTQIVQANGTRP